jgi:peptide/nickel transport system substrate-binding protein
LIDAYPSLWTSPFSDALRRFGRPFCRLLLCLLAASLFFLNQSCQRKRPPGELVVAEESAPTDFDPRFALDAYSARINRLLYAGLVARDAKARIVPDLALSWSNPDDQTYVFFLRPGLQFHDGRSLTAADVAATFTSILDPALSSPVREVYADIEDVVALDEQTIRFRLKRPFAPFLESLTMGIVPAGSGRELARKPIGAGAFRLADFEPGYRTTLTPFEHYHAGPPKLRRIVIKAVPNDITRILELRKGSVQLLINSVPPDALAQLRENEDLRVYEQPGLNVSYLGFNLRDPVLGVPAVREAIALAVDREAIIRHLLKGGASPAETVLAPMLWSHADDLSAQPHDPAQARMLLDRAGFGHPGGDPTRPRFSMIYKTSTNPLRRRIADAISQQLAEVGIKVEVRSLEFATFFDDIRSGNFQMFSLTWVGLTEPDALFNLFHSASLPPAGANRGGYLNAEVDGLLERGRRELREDARHAIYRQAQHQIAAERPYVHLWVQNDVAVASTRLRDFVLYPGGDYAGLIDAWLLDVGRQTSDVGGELGDR